MQLPLITCLSYFDWVHCVDESDPVAARCFYGCRWWLELWDFRTLLVPRRPNYTSHLYLPKPTIYYCFVRIGSVCERGSSTRGTIAGRSAMEVMPQQVCSTLAMKRYGGRRLDQIRSDQSIYQHSCTKCPLGSLVYFEVEILYGLCKTLESSTPDNCGRSRRWVLCILFMMRGACPSPLLEPCFVMVFSFEGYQYKLIDPIMGSNSSNTHMGVLLLHRWANPLRKCIHRDQSWESNAPRWPWMTHLGALLPRIRVPISRYSVSAVLRCKY